MPESEGPGKSETATIIKLEPGQAPPKDATVLIPLEPDTVFVICQVLVRVGMFNAACRVAGKPASLKWVNALQELALKYTAQQEDEFHEELKRLLQR